MYWIVFKHSKQCYQAWNPSLRRLTQYYSFQHSLANAIRSGCMLLLPEGEETYFNTGDVVEIINGDHLMCRVVSCGPVDPAKEIKEVKTKLENQGLQNVHITITYQEVTTKVTSV